MPIPMPGTLFLFRGPRTSWLRRSKLLGQVLAIEPGDGIVHVTTLWEPPGKDFLMAEIGFIPMAAQMIEPSILEVVAAREAGTGWWPILQEWRLQRGQGLTGAFSIPLHEVYRLAWDIVRENQPQASRENLFLEYAFPASDSGSQPLRSIHVSTLPRVWSEDTP